MMNRYRFVTMVLSVLLFPAFAMAQPDPPPDAEPGMGDQRFFGLAANIGLFQGFGGGVRVGSTGFGIAASGAWLPVIISVQRSAEDPPEFEFYSSGQVNGDLYVRFAEAGPQTEIGGQGGYRYNTLLGHGGALGGYANIDLGPSLVGQVAGGILIFPDGEKRVLREADLPDGAYFNFPGPSFQIGVSLGLLLFP